MHLSLFLENKSFFNFFYLTQMSLSLKKNTILKKNLISKKYSNFILKQHIKITNKTKDVSQLFIPKHLYFS